MLERGRRSRRWCRRRRRRPRRRRPSPTRTPTSSSSTACTAPTRSYDYGTHFLFQGHESGVDGARLHHPDQPRRRRRAPRDAAGDAGRDRRADRRRSTARPGTRGRSACCFTTENASAPTYAATPDYPSTVDRHLRRARPRRLRGHPERLATATSGSSRTSAAPTRPGTTAKQPEQLRLPLRAGAARATSHNGKLQVLQVLQRRRQPDHVRVARRRSTAPTRSRCTPTARRSRRSGSRSTTPPPTAPRRSTPTRSRRRRTATPFKRPENGAVPPGHGLPRVLLRRDRRHRRHEPGERRPRAAGARCFKLTQSEPVGATPATLSLFYKGDQAHAGFDNVDVPLARPGRVRRGRRRHAARPAQRARLRLRARRHARLLEARRPAGPLARRGPRRVGDARLRATAASARTTATTRSPASTSPTATRAPAGSSARRRPTCGDGGWRWFYTQQHGDNPTYEVLLGDRHGAGDD